MSTLGTAILVLIGGGLGSGCRYLIIEAFAARRRTSSGPFFDWATLLVNVVGSFVLGVVAALADLESAGAPGGFALAGVGFCGGFTAFAAFAMDLVAMVEARAWRLLTGTLVVNVLGGLAAAALGFGFIILFG